MHLVATAVLVLQGLRVGHLAWARWRRPAPERPERVPEAWPRVCVQVPVYNEPAVVARAVAAACALDYPALELQILDDSDDGVTPGRAAHAVAEAVGAGCAAVHLRRASRAGFKAGALAAGLARTDAPLVAVLDADFAPAPDFLRRLVPALLADPALAFVQARWTHVNAAASVLTRAQAALLDLHFAVEQAGRDRLRRFLPFNGTAGVWRRAAIDAAGGWSGDTLAEDLDLALRARMAGRGGAFLGSVEAPAELPASVRAWQRQQARWAKGMTEVLRRLGGRWWRSGRPLGERAAALLDVSAPLAYPALLAVIVLHPALGLAWAHGAGPGPALTAALGFGWLGLAGAVLAHAVAQAALHPARPALARVGHGALGLAASVALAAPGTWAVGEALAGRATPFERTPKGAAAAPGQGASRGTWALAAASAAGLAALVGAGAWLAVAFQAVFAAATGWACVAGARRTSRPWALPRLRARAS